MNDDTSEKKPRPHSIGATPPVGHMNPAGHALHELGDDDTDDFKLFTGPYVPPGQLKREEPPEQYDPRGHAKH